MGQSQNYELHESETKHDILYESIFKSSKVIEIWSIDA